MDKVVNCNNPFSPSDMEKKDREQHLTFNFLIVAPFMASGRHACSNADIILGRMCPKRKGQPRT
jgi:hypothetical protein